MTNKTKIKMISVGFMLPAVIIVISLVIYPIILNLVISFQNVRFFGAMDQDIHFTLENYHKLLYSKSFWYSLNITLIYTLATVSVAFVIGLVTALFLKLKFKGNRIARIVFLLAWPIPQIAVGLMFMWMFDPSFGVINYILRSLKIISTNVMWLSSAKTALATAIGAMAWKEYPFFTLMLYAGLQAIPTELYEAASVDGVTAIDRFRYITLPALRTVITITLLLSVLSVFRSFDIIFLLTGGGPARSTETLPIKLYQETFLYYHMGYAAAIGVVCLIICVMIIAAFTPLFRKEFY